jgi:hypothetical protein
MTESAQKHLKSIAELGDTHMKKLAPKRRLGGSRGTLLSDITPPGVLTLSGTSLTSTFLPAKGGWALLSRFDHNEDEDRYGTK